MKKLQVYDSEILETKFTDDVLQKIREAEFNFGFNELDLTKKLIELLCYTINQYHLEIRKSKTQRDSVVRKELVEINEKLTEISNVLKSSSLKFHLSFTNINNHILMNRFQNDLPVVINEIQLSINKLDDSGGKTPYSIQKFLTFNLLHILSQATKKVPKCWWKLTKKNEETGAGDGYEFLVAMREILPQINPYLLLSSDNKTLCNCGAEILSEFNKSNIFCHTIET